MAFNVSKSVYNALWIVIINENSDITRFFTSLVLSIG